LEKEEKMTNTAIFIPARLGATRLPNKPLADIGGKPMLIHCAEKARDANVGDVFITCPDQELVDLAAKHGFKAILTPHEINTGTDRIYAAYQACGKEYDYIVNLQGDIPLISPSTIKHAVEILQESNDDISTIATLMEDESEKTNPNVVKAIIAINGRALYFTRTSNSPHGEGDMYHHVGIYVYRKEALNKFVQLKQTPLELRERLEQLRALENGMTIRICVVKDVALGVDTPDDLEKIRGIYSASLK
jgi:3-deoxy-manno-octulosonate cytidylyltransferase (CMP-KDO synthetase)